MYHVAIPSHGRASTISAKTLRLLAERGVPREAVMVFATEEQTDEYREAVDPGLCREVIPSPKGLANNRNHIAEWFQTGEQVIQIDDDVEDVRRKVDDKTTEPVADLPEMFEEAFRESKMAGANLWGIYPVLNPMFMKNRHSTGLRFCIGQLFGTFNTHYSFGQVELDQKDDYERTLRHWQHDGTVLRLDDVAVKSPLYGAGGMQASDQENRQTLNRKAVRYLLRQFPNNVRVQKRRSRVGLEIRLVEK